MFASGSVVYGVIKWRIEFVGKKRIDLAEETLALFYEARDVIAGIRSPLVWREEGSTREFDGNETEEEQEILKQAHVYYERYEKNRELFSKIHSMRYRFMALFGQREEEAFNDLNAIVNEVISAANLIADYKLGFARGEIDEEQWQEIRKTIKEKRAVIWAAYSKEDPIRQRIKKIIERIEEKCRPVIDKKSFLKRFLKWVGFN